MAEVDRTKPLGPGSCTNIKKITTLNFLYENLEKFCLTEHVSCASRWIDNFSLAQLHKPYSVGKLSIGRAQICIFSRTGRKTKKSWRSNLFPSTIFQYGLLKESIFLLRYSYSSHTPLESSQLGEQKYAISARYDVRSKNNSSLNEKFQGETVIVWSVVIPV